MAVIACWILARDVSRSVQAATIAALLLTCSPVFVIYSGQVMTDVPAVLLLGLSLIIHLRGIQKRNIWLVLIGAALLGAGVNLRETIGFYAPWLVLAPFVCGWKPGRREIFLVALSCVIFVLFSGGEFAYWFVSDPAYREGWYGWRESMRQESTLHPVGRLALKCSVHEEHLVRTWWRSDFPMVGHPADQPTAWNRRKSGSTW